MILFLLIAVIPFLGMNLRNLGYPTLADLIVLFNPLFFLQSQGNFWMALVASHVNSSTGVLALSDGLLKAKTPVEELTC